jgi:hypothetical protein
MPDVKLTFEQWLKTYYPEVDPNDFGEASRLKIEYDTQYNKATNKFDIPDVGTYQSRLSEYLANLIKDNAISPDDAISFKNQTDEYVKSVNDGSLTLKDLPLYNDLSRSDYDFWYTSDTQKNKNAANQQQDYADYKAQTEAEQLRSTGMAQARQFSGGYEPSSITATSPEQLAQLAQGRVVKQGDTADSMRQEVRAGKATPYFIDTSAMANALTNMEQQKDYNFIPSSTPLLDAYKRKYGGKRTNWFSGG